jgi:hypothetical protein
MIIGMEETPQIQPAVCSFLGFGSAPGRKFIRLIAPNDVFSDTLLMSDVAFNEIAKMFEYVPVGTLLKGVDELRAELANVDSNINNLALELSSVGAIMAGLSSFDASIENLRKLLNTIRKRVGDAVTTVTEPVGPAEVIIESSPVQ